MGWQNTFTLGKREKGCHLVTEEVLTHIRPGLEGVKASLFLSFVASHESLTLLITGWNAVSFHAGTFPTMRNYKR